MHSQNMEVPGPGTELTPQYPPVSQLLQHQIPNAPCQAGDGTCASIVTRVAAETRLET